MRCLANNWPSAIPVANSPYLYLSYRCTGCISSAMSENVALEGNVLLGYMSTSHGQYEWDPDAVKTWLSLAAKACGFETVAKFKEAEAAEPHAPSSRQQAAAPSQWLKGKER